MKKLLLGLLAITSLAITGCNENEVTTNNKHIKVHEYCLGYNYKQYYCNRVTEYHGAIEEANISVKHIDTITVSPGESAKYLHAHIIVYYWGD